jgi:hypothetical protein
MNFNVCYFLAVQSLSVKVDAHSQEINCKRSFKIGSLLLTLLSTTIMRAKFSIMGLQTGLLEATRTENGKKTVPYCGFLEIVSFFHPFCLDVHPLPFQFRSWCREKRPLVCCLCLLLLLKND